MDIGTLIRKHRLENGLTQKQLAELLGVATGTIQQYELNKREPRFETLKQLSTVLNFNLLDALGAELKSPNNIICSKSNYKNLLDTSFNKLNNLGKKEAVKRVEELAEIPKYVTYKKENLNAAHALDNSTDKEKANDDLIMDKDDEWTL